MEAISMTPSALERLTRKQGKCLPKNYFEHYGVDKFEAPSLLTNYGYTHLIWEVSRKNGLYSCIEKTFGKETDEIIALAAHIIINGNVMDGIDDWQDRNFLPGVDCRLSSQSTSRFFSDIEAEEADSFFRDWIELNLQGNNVCYDVTSISSYAEDMVTLEFDYNRDQEKLTQFNLGVFCDEITKIPLYYSRYSGSLTDRTNLPNVLEDVRELGIEDVKLVVDGGFWSPTAFKSLKKDRKTFTVGFLAYLDEARQIIAEHGESVKHYEFKIGFPHINCKEIASTIHGVPRKVLLFFDHWGYADDRHSLDSHLERVKIELSQRKQFRKYKGDYYKD